MCCCGSRAAVLGTVTVIHFRWREACTGPPGALAIAQHRGLHALPKQQCCGKGPGQGQDSLPHFLEKHLTCQVLRNPGVSCTWTGTFPTHPSSAVTASLKSAHPHAAAHPCWRAGKSCNPHSGMRGTAACSILPTAVSIAVKSVARKVCAPLVPVGCVSFSCQTPLELPGGGCAWCRWVPYTSLRPPGSP